MTLAFGSVFAGIGGFDLGFERAGMRCEWQVEIDPFCREVLAKHWPFVRRHDDIRTFVPTYVDVVCGGFPCQDISRANHKAKGIDGERSGLWGEMFRVVNEVRPRVVVVENVPEIARRGLDRVTGNLSSVGYGCAWDIVSAAEFGAPIRRDRLFIVAVADGIRWDASAFFARDVTECSIEEARRILWPGNIGRGHSDRLRWLPAPGIERVVVGIPSGMDAHRLRAIGNTVCPHICRWIAKKIVAILGTPWCEVPE